jgi:eight-cysteine-cluster-containing protein
MKLIQTLGLLILAAMFAILAMWVYSIAPKMQASIPAPVITNFEECAQAGNPVMESYPRQCRSVDGRLFVEEVPPPALPDGGTVFNGCTVAGCSGQLCVSADEAANIVTTCEYRAEYACYKEASCEPQVDGKCGWTQTASLRQCLAAPPSIETTLQVM